MSRWRWKYLNWKEKLFTALFWVIMPWHMHQRGLERERVVRIYHGKESLLHQEGDLVELATSELLGPDGEPFPEGTQAGIKRITADRLLDLNIVLETYVELPNGQVAAGWSLHSHTCRNVDPKKVRFIKPAMYGITYGTGGFPCE